MTPSIDLVAQQGANSSQTSYSQTSYSVQSQEKIILIEFVGNVQFQEYCRSA